MACAHCGRPYIVAYDHVSRGCYCHWHVGRVAKPKGDNSYLASSPTGVTSGGWDWLARVYNEATD